MKTPRSADSRWRLVAMGKLLHGTACRGEALRRRFPAISGMPALPMGIIDRLRQSSRKWLGTRLAIIPSPS